MLAPREKLGVALGVIGTCLFGATLPATRLAVDFFDPLFVSAARAVIAGLLGVGVLLATRRRWPRHMLGELIAAGLCTIVGYPVFIALALKTVPASHGGVVLGIMPLATMAAAALWLRERPTLGFWLASAAGSLLVVLFVMRHHNNGALVSRGDLYLIGAVVTGAFGYTLSGSLSGQRPGWEVISWQVALFLPLTAAATVALWPPDVAEAPASAWAGLAYVATVSMYLAFFVFNAAMALAGVARIGQLTLLQPFIIVALSIPVNGETFEPETLLFAAAVVAAVVAGQRMGVRRRR